MCGFLHLRRRRKCPAEAVDYFCAKVKSRSSRGYGDFSEIYINLSHSFYYYVLRKYLIIKRVLLCAAINFTRADIYQSNFHCDRLKKFY